MNLGIPKVIVEKQNRMVLFTISVIFPAEATRGFGNIAPSVTKRYYKTVPFGLAVDIMPTPLFLHFLL